MSHETLIYEKENGIAIVTLNRPASVNAINTQMHNELEEVVADIESDREVRVVIITGGQKCFCAGADIKEKLPPGVMRKGEAELWRRIENLDRPVIAAISGYALGGGLQLALACDLRIASETAQFGLPEVKLGAAPGSGGMQRLPRTIGITKAKEMLFLGDPIDAEEGYRVGLVNKVVPVASLMDETKKLASTLASRAPHALKIAKKCVDIGLQMDLVSALEFDTAYTRSEMSSAEALALFQKQKDAFAERHSPETGTQ